LRKRRVGSTPTPGTSHAIDSRLVDIVPGVRYGSRGVHVSTLLIVPVIEVGG